jgi:hypothetical protein
MDLGSPVKTGSSDSVPRFVNSTKSWSRVTDGEHIELRGKLHSKPVLLRSAGGGAYITKR